MKFVVVPELKGRWVWELRTPEGTLLLKSPGSLSTQVEVVAAVEALKRAVGLADIYDLVGSQLSQPADASASGAPGG